MSGGRQNSVYVGRNGRIQGGVYGGGDVGCVCVDQNVCGHIYKGMWGVVYGYTGGCVGDKRCVEG